MSTSTTIPIYGLRLAAVRVQDFKSLRDVVVEFSSGTTVLLGENNSGKTSLLEALDVAFGRRQPRSTDLHEGPGHKATSFVVDLKIEPSDRKEFPQFVVDEVGDSLQLEMGSVPYFTIRASATLAAQNWDLNLTRTFIKGWDVDRGRSSALDKLSPVGRVVLGLLHYDMLDARRDIVEQLRNRRSHWGRTASNIAIPDATKVTLEANLKSLGQQLTTNSPVLSQVRNDLGFLSHGLSSGALNVDLEALPRTVDDLMRAMDIVITAQKSSPFSVESHGMGTRSLSALLVFRSYVNVIRGRHQPETLLSVSAFEEPEAHLHPQSQRAVFDILSEIGGQRIVSTHSQHVASIANLEDYRVFRRSGPETTVSSVQAAQSKTWNAELVRRFVQQENPEVLFAKAVGIVEGQTEAAAFPVFARAWWEPRGADGVGVSLIYTGGAGNSKHIVPFLDALRIPWVLFCDGDKAGQEGLAATADSIQRTLDLNSPEVVMLPGGHSFEHYLLDQGYLPQARAAVDRHPEGDLVHYKSKAQGTTRKAKEGGGVRDYQGEDGDRLACLDFLLKEKGTIGGLVAEELVRPSGDPAAIAWPERVKDFFERLDNVRQ